MSGRAELFLESLSPSKGSNNLTLDERIPVSTSATPTVESIPRPTTAAPPLFRLPPLPTPSRVCSYIAVCAHRIRLSQQTSRLGNRLLAEKSCLATTAVATRGGPHVCRLSLSLSLQLLTIFCQHRYCIAGSIESHSEGKVIKDIVSGDTHVKNIGASDGRSISLPVRLVQACMHHCAHLL